MIVYVVEATGGAAAPLDMDAGGWARVERMLRELECDPGTQLFAELLELPLPNCHRPEGKEAL